MRSYLMSFLSTRAALLREGFSAKHPGAWLVWEPGAWHAPELGGASASTTLLGIRPVSSPAAGDALCFQLVLAAGQSAVTVGRDERNAVVINDATVSREHLALSFAESDGWRAEPAPGRVVKMNGAPLAEGRAAPLRSGDRLELGGVTCAFYDAAGFGQRLAAELKK